MSETLWAPWRMEYILGKKPDGCVFCEAIESGAEKHQEHLILCETKLAFVIMNRFPYAHAHIMILPKRHVAWLEDLTKEEHRDLFDLVVAAQTALKSTLNPQGLNVGINLGEAAGAGIEYHLHVHVVPRWQGDSNFMPVLADVRTMPEHLEQTYSTLLPAFQKLNSK